MQDSTPHGKPPNRPARLPSWMRMAGVIVASLCLGIAIGYVAPHRYDQLQQPSGTGSPSSASGEATSLICYVHDTFMGLATSRDGDRLFLTNTTSNFILDSQLRSDSLPLSSLKIGELYTVVFRSDRSGDRVISIRAEPSPSGYATCPVG